MQGVISCWGVVSVVLVAVRSPTSGVVSESNEKTLDPE